MGMHVEYLGFSIKSKDREYRLRARDGEVSHDFVRAIPLEAFITRRARYQDAAEICFLNLQHELAACEGTMPEAYLSITDSELEAYRAAHSPKPSTRRPKPVPQS